jgi:hypothetical protein
MGITLNRSRYYMTGQRNLERKYHSTLVRIFYAVRHVGWLNLLPSVSVVQGWSASVALPFSAAGGNPHRPHEGLSARLLYFSRKLAAVARKGGFGDEEGSDGSIVKVRGLTWPMPIVGRTAGALCFPVLLFMLPPVLERKCKPVPSTVTGGSCESA